MEVDYWDHVKEMMDKLLLQNHGVGEGKAFGFPAYKIYGKEFVIVAQNGIAINLPELRVQQLAAAYPAMEVLQPIEGIFWKSWLLIEYPDPERLLRHFDLMEESFNYVKQTLQKRF